MDDPVAKKPRKDAPLRPQCSRNIHGHLSSVNALRFGTIFSHCPTLSLIVAIENQTQLPSMTYHQIRQLLAIEMELTEEQFIRMWRTLVLKRAQDVYRATSGAQPPNLIRLPRTILLPGPLGELIYSLGLGFSPSTGWRIRTVPPVLSDPLPPWATPDPVIVEAWQNMTARIDTLYTQYQFPSFADYEDRLIGLTTISDDANDFRTVRSWTNESTPSERYLRFVFDDLFAANSRININSCRFMIAAPLHLPTIRSDYCGSFVKKELA